MRAVRDRDRDQVVVLLDGDDGDEGRTCTPGSARQAASSAVSRSGWYIMYHSAQPLAPVSSKRCSISTSPDAPVHS